MFLIIIPSISISLPHFPPFSPIFHSDLLLRTIRPVCIPYRIDGAVAVG